MVSNTNASNIKGPLPIYPAEIIARDLAFKGAGWTGHVGITTAPSLYQDAYQVLEALWEDPVLQTNTIATFKTKSAYWGSRYGISDRGANALRILREANFQKDLGCAKYTLTTHYNPSKGGYNPKPVPTYCGFFRCDTFVNYLFHWGNYTLPTYSPPGIIGIITLPRLVFNAFPLGNGDGPLSLDYIAPYKSSTAETNELVEVTIRSVTSKQLNVMNPEEFYSFIEVPSISNDGIKNLLKLAQDPILTAEKRAFLIDTLGFVGTVDMISDLIELYNKLNDFDDLAIKNQILASSLNLYQRFSFLEQNPHEKDLLQKFYLNNLDKKLVSTDKEVIIRGLITLNPIESTISNINKILSKINELDNPLSPQTALKLKMELFNKSSQLEGILLPEIINMLQHENNAELDGIFNAFIVHRLSQLGPQSLAKQSKDEISIYLDSIKFKYDTSNKIVNDDGMNLVSYGSWLEATALVNSASLEDAGKYVANYLQNKNIKEQERYITGLSNSDYMKKAFETESILIDFRRMHHSIYSNTVGISKK